MSSSKKILSFDMIRVFDLWTRRHPNERNWGKPYEEVREELMNLIDDGDGSYASYHSAVAVLKSAETDKLHGRANQGMDWIRQEWRRGKEVKYHTWDSEQMSDESDADYGIRVARFVDDMRVCFDHNPLVLSMRGGRKHRYGVVQSECSHDMLMVDISTIRTPCHEGWTFLKGPSRNPEISSWLHENAPGAHAIGRFMGEIYAFRDESVAVLFMLRFG